MAVRKVSVGLARVPVALQLAQRQRPEDFLGHGEFAQLSLKVASVANLREPPADL
jgi:hypothetical protein